MKFTTKAFKVGVEIFAREKMTHLKSIVLTKSAINKMHASKAAIKTAEKVMKIIFR